MSISPGRTATTRRASPAAAGVASNRKEKAMKRTDVSLTHALRFVMRFVLPTCAAIALGACFNVTDPDHPPPVVDPPVISCTVPTDAGCDPFSTTCDAGKPVYLDYICELPPSVCADSHWAAYFDNGTCVNGTCQLVTKYHYCATGCSNGGCVVNNGPTAPSRGF